MYEHLSKLEDYIGWKVTRLYPPHDWNYYMFEHIPLRGNRKGIAGNGWPWRQSRWCTREKINALIKHVKGETVCIGFSYRERFRRPNYRHANQRYPLLEWGVTDQEALKYCQKYGFDFSGLYKMFKSVSCWCCPLKPERELKALKDNFPDLWQRLLEMDSKSPYPHPRRDLIRGMK